MRKSGKPYITMDVTMKKEVEVCLVFQLAVQYWAIKEGIQIYIHT